MKKKKRILALIFSFILIFLVGCAEGGEIDEDLGGDSEFDDEWSDEDLKDLYGDTPIEMEGVKVLSKPESYDFNVALGDNSVNYYNLFARHLLNYLYNVYENPTNIDNDDDKNAIFKTTKTIDSSTITYTTDNSFNNNENRFYLFDSIRYTIESVDTTSKDDTTTQTITLKYNAWNWNIKPDASNKKVGEEIAEYKQIFFLNLPEDLRLQEDNKFTILDERNLQTLYTDFNPRIPSFKEFYYAGENKINEGNDSCYPSPFYSPDAELSNYFQDALEYAIYLFVLGYDYTITEDAPLFEFHIQYGQGDKLGHVTGITVDGWGSEAIEIEDALGRVKKMYQEDGGYVGLTEKNRQQVVDFILDKIIGENAIGDKDGEFEVKIKNGISTNSLKFDRRYSEIVNNIVAYACGQVSIGTTKKEGVETPLFLNGQPYPTSVITDYVGNYFGGSYENDDDANMFGHIERAEYQSIVFYPPSDAFENGTFTLGDIWLAVEYWDGEHETWAEYNASAPSDQKRFLEEITITVGLRVFSKSQNKLIAGGDKPIEIKKTIEFGKYPPKYTNVDEYADAYEKNLFTFNNSGTGSDVAFGDVSIDSQFNKNIGSGAINPFAVGEGGSAMHKQITVEGSGSAKEYYRLNESSSYGFFGTLNEEMFGGSDGCDYIEIYFDIQKTKGVTGANYNFKVCVLQFLPAETV